jgi:hypothetical protein
MEQHEKQYGISMASVWYQYGEVAPGTALASHIRAAFGNSAVSKEQRTAYKQQVTASHSDSKGGQGARPVISSHVTVGVERATTYCRIFWLLIFAGTWHPLAE